MKNDRETIQFMLKDIANRSHLLNEWEEGFIANIEDWFLKGKELTPSMDKKLDQIYEKVTENG